jgi:hypothetical protein
MVKCIDVVTCLICGQDTEKRMIFNNSVQSNAVLIYLLNSTKASYELITGKEKKKERPRTEYKTQCDL